MGTFVCRHSENTSDFGVQILVSIWYAFVYSIKWTLVSKKKHKGTSKSDINDKICTAFKLDFAIYPFLSS